MPLLSFIRFALQVVAGIGLVVLSFSGTPPESNEKSDVDVLSDRPVQVTRCVDSIAHSNGLLIGQNIGHANFDIRDGHYQTVTRLEEQTGHPPAILALDYGYGEIPGSLELANRIAVRFARAGGIVSVSMHPPNPWTGGGPNDLNVGTLSELYTPGTVANRRYRENLRRVANGLSQLRDAGVVVLWRPLHEMNGGWFWWCAERDGQWPTKEQFVELWRSDFRYFTVEKGLDNLVWVYAAAVQTEQHHRTVDYYYPGDEFVDLVGLDWYSDDFRSLDRYGSYSALAEMGKPMGLTEFGPKRQRDGTFNNLRVLDIANNYPALRFISFWHSWPNNKVAIVDHKNAGRLLKNERVIDLRRLAERQSHVTE